MQTVTFGFSPCPNDTFLFYPLVHGRINTAPFRLHEHLEDIETLNTRALNGELDLCKVSCHAYAHLRDRYVLLRAGGAMGRGCGPLVVSRTGIAARDLREKQIAVPGRLTTATLLLQLFDPSLTDLVVLPFREIVPAIAEGRVDAGVIIHESRFTFAAHGLQITLDLGLWWERETNLPLPLGGIAALRSLGTETLSNLNNLLRASVCYACANPEESTNYIRSHAQEVDEAICAAHVNLFVNKFSLDPGKEGEQALQHLLSRGELLGLLPPTDHTPCFISST
jgi:1,4-dihydroxy-6-naphthoate synthase